MKLTDSEQELVARMLDRLADMLGDNGCNDLPDEWEKLFSARELRELSRQYHELNGDPQDDNGTNQDNTLARLMAEKVRRL